MDRSTKEMLKTISEGIFITILFGIFVYLLLGLADWLIGDPLNIISNLN